MKNTNGKILKSFLLASCLSAGSLLANDNAQININNETLEVSANIYLNSRADVSNKSNYYINAGILKTDNSDGDDQYLATVGLKILNPLVDAKGLSFGLGIKGVYTDFGADTAYTFPLGLFAKFELNEVIYFDAEASYAPTVLSSSQIDSYKDFKFRANYKVLEDGYVFAGTRYIKVDTANYGDVGYDTTMFVGYELRF